MAGFATVTWTSLVAYKWGQIDICAQIQIFPTGTSEMDLTF